MPEIKKKKHVSKKNKKDWRKHCDINDVEAFLEDQRLEERLGKFETKPDSELFVIDTGDADQTPKVEEHKALTAKERRRAKLSAIPKCFETLLPTSKVEDPNAKRNHVNPVGTKPTALSKITHQKRVKKGVYEKKLEQARTNRKIAIDKRKKGKQAKTFNIQLWGDDGLETKGVPSSLVDDFVSPEAQLHNVAPARRLRPKPPLAKSVVTRAAVELPHPGVSYNPTFKEHQELLQEVVQHETKMMKREAHLHRVTSAMFSKLSAKENEEQWRAEMSAGLPATADAESASDSAADSASDNEYRAVNPPVKNKKKDHKARRKQREQLVEKERLKQLKINKKKISDLYTLRKLQSSILTKEQKQAAEREERQSKRALKEATALPQLSGHKTPKAEPDFVEPSSLTGDLRQIANNTNLLRERYHSLQRRGAIAAAKLMMKKNRKLKSYFKPGHKVTDAEVDRFMKNFEAKKNAKTGA